MQHTPMPVRRRRLPAAAALLSLLLVLLAALPVGAAQRAVLGEIFSSAG